MSGDRTFNGGNMNSLQNLSDYGRKAVIAITIFSTLVLAAAAQKVEPQKQGKMYGEPGFVGEPIIEGLLQQLGGPYRFDLDQSEDIGPLAGVHFENRLG